MQGWSLCAVTLWSPAVLRSEPGLCPSRGVRQTSSRHHNSRTGGGKIPVFSAAGAVTQRKTIEASDLRRNDLVVWQPIRDGPVPSE